MSMFQQPSEGGDRAPIAELVGSLVLIWAREHRENITTSLGVKDAIAGDLHVLDGPKGGEKFLNVLLFQGAIIGSLRPAVGGDPVLARIGQGTARPGQNAPFILLPYTDTDAAVATAYVQRLPKPFQAPAAPLAAVPTPPPAAPAVPAAPGGMTPEAFAALPPEVQALLQQTASA